MPLEDLGTGQSLVDAGQVNVLYGTTSSGLQATSPDDQEWHQNIAEVRDFSESSDLFSFAALAAGDYNNDGRYDLGIGVPFEDLGTENNNGAVNVIYGGSSGLQATNPDDNFWHADNDGNNDSDSLNNAHFGSALA